MVEAKVLDWGSPTERVLEIHKNRPLASKPAQVGTKVAPEVFFHYLHPEVSFLLQLHQEVRFLLHMKT